LAAVLVLGLVSAACAAGDGQVLAEAVPSLAAEGAPARPAATTTLAATQPTTAAPTTPTTSTAPAAPTTTAAPFVAPAPGSIAVRTPSGILALWHGFTDDGRMVVSTPCDRRAAIAPSPAVRSVDVLLDPGHGGLDPGARAENGLTEAELNLDVARRATAMLRAAGRTVELTRDDDSFRTLADRAQLATAIAPRAFVSIHHNSGMDAPSTAGIGSEVYHQLASPEARRLGGLVYEELTRWFLPLDVRWTRGARFGVRFRDNGAGQDFYGVLRRSAGVPAILIEAAYLSNAREAEVLRTEQFRDAEARAITLGILRWLTTADAGTGYQDGFVEGGTGGNSDLTTCRDPDLERPRP
jgi:N-acetylmuramoyl-L-alanine amidase